MEIRFRLTLQYSGNTKNKWDVSGYDIIEATDLVELLSKFLLIIAGISRTIIQHTERTIIGDEDVPF